MEDNQPDSPKPQRLTRSGPIPDGAFTAPPRAARPARAGWIVVVLAAAGAASVWLFVTREPTKAPAPPPRAVSSAASASRSLPAPAAARTGVLLSALPRDPRWSEPPVAPIPRPVTASGDEAGVDFHWVHLNQTEDLYKWGVYVAVDGVSRGLQELVVREEDHLGRMRLRMGDDIPGEIVRRIGVGGKQALDPDRPADFIDSGEAKNRTRACVANDATDSPRVGPLECPMWSSAYHPVNRFRLIVPVVGNDVEHSVRITKVAAVQGPEGTANFLKTTEIFRREPGTRSAWRQVSSRSVTLYSRRVEIRRDDGKLLTPYAAPVIDDSVFSTDPQDEALGR